MTSAARDELRAALSPFAGDGGGARVLVVWHAARSGLTAEGLDVVETERVGRLRRAADRDRYLTAHHLARVVTGEALGRSSRDVAFDRTCPRCGAQHGRPVVVDTPAGRAGSRAPSISLTHSGDVVGVALRLGGCVGLDVEEPWPDGGEDRLAGMVRAPGEDRTIDLRGLWVTKEAVLKAAGLGLTEAMTEVVVTGGHALLSGERWWCREVDAAPGYRAAVAGDGEPVEDVRVVGFTDLV